MAGPAEGRSSAREATSTAALDWVGHLRRVIDAGAGEIVLNAVDRDGAMAGMDTGLISEAAGATTVPLVAVGGVGSLAHIKDAIRGRRRRRGMRIVLRLPWPPASRADHLPRLCRSVRTPGDRR